jgi:integrase/recombinase XerD
MESFKKYLQENGYAKSTIGGHISATYCYLTWLDEEQIEADQVRHADVLAYVKHLKNKRIKQVTIRAYIGSVKLFYDYRIHLKQLTKNPAKHIEIKGIVRRRLYHIFTPDELHGLYTNYPIIEETENPAQPTQRSLKSKREKVILGLFVYQGIQSMELSRLVVKDIDLRQGQITIPGSRKSNERTLQLESVQILDLMEYLMNARNEILKQTGQETEKLIVGVLGGDDVGNHVYRLMQQLKKNQNQKVKNAQQIRASVIVKWLRQYNLRQVQYRAGHRCISSTEHYKVNDMESLQEDINRFHPQN